MAFCEPSVPTYPASASCEPNSVFDCPACPVDFDIDPVSAVVLVDGGELTIVASDAPGTWGGTYSWMTTSDKIKLRDEESPIVTVESLVNVSSARDAEVVVATRTSPGCGPIAKAVRLTVVSIKFSASTNQRYGYDDLDTPSDSKDDHICVKAGDHTFVAVSVLGGGVGTDFDFEVEDPSFCTIGPPAAAATFDLQIFGGSRTKAETKLHAKTKSGKVAATLHVHVYKENVVPVYVRKVWDRTSAGTAHMFPTALYASHQTLANDKLKEAVVRFSITDGDGAGVCDLPYDQDRNGRLTYDIAAGGGVEVAQLVLLFGFHPGATRVAIVREMISYYYTDIFTTTGATFAVLTADSVFDFPAGVWLGFGKGPSFERVQVVAVRGRHVFFAAALGKSHPAGDPLEFPAAGWSSDPIIIREDPSLSITKWTVLHEVGHLTLGLHDITDPTNFMHFDQNWTDYRLRYCPRPLHYDSGTQNQWDTIPR